ncbi:HpcH/HpaI aldolase family protein [Fuscibacter oryzae]|uniref:Hydroxypyruvate/pyruvate aldolase n=1 Tax=Fuscibacter oryzae TaxID=2803939 RepID=A0A8J7STH3_9RHOB|nr:HpcH/HpaI aldolase/citrate lyase family protein [Fuscibacter oryzae]MBL4929196.1 HpcH/HpaI aldolase/citrate lyase family protein [Fuscibacter oryzae]
MPAPKNPLKQALAECRVQTGIWVNLASPIAVDLLAGAGFDWLLLDGEHGPNTIPTLLTQAQVIGQRCNVVVRPPAGEVRMIKQILDLGVQNVLVPMVDSVEQAQAMARAMRYPPAGVRGLGASVARAADYGRTPEYMANADDEVCLILQVESRAGLAALPGILAVDGVDGVFIGPSDLAADMGFRGDTTHPDVLKAIEGAIAQITASGKAAGILTFDEALARRYRDMGVTFLGVGSDVNLLMRAAGGLAERAR